MTLLRQIITTLLVAYLALVIGLGGIAHAMWDDCAGDHCADHIHVSMDARTASQAQIQLAGDVSPDTDIISHEGCNPFLCNVLVFTQQRADMDIDPSGKATASHVEWFLVLGEPENPERPPNF